MVTDAVLQSIGEVTGQRKTRLHLDSNPLTGELFRPGDSTLEHLPRLAGFSGNAGCSATAPHASFRYSHYDERLW